MKAATGELNLTLITVVALGAVLALFMGVIWPNLKERINNKTNDESGDTQEFDTGFNTNVEFTKYIETELF